MFKNQSKTESTLSLFSFSSLQAVKIIMCTVFERTQLFKKEKAWKPVVRSKNACDQSSYLPFLSNACFVKWEIIFIVLRKTLFFTFESHALCNWKRFSFHVPKIDFATYVSIVTEKNARFCLNDGDR